MAKRRWRDVVGLAVCAALQAIASVYYGVMTALVLVVSAGVLAASTGQWRARRLWTRLAAAAVLAGVLTAPVLIPYVRSQDAEGFGRTLFEAANHSASLRSYTQVPPVNLAYGWTGLLAPRASPPGARDRRGVEDQLFPGFVVSVLAIVGFLSAIRSDSRPLVLSGAVLLGCGFVLSLGPEGIRTALRLAARQRLWLSGDSCAGAIRHGDDARPRPAGGIGNETGDRLG